MTTRGISCATARAFAIPGTYLAILRAIAGGATRAQRDRAEGGRADRQPGAQARAPRGSRVRRTALAARRRRVRDAAQLRRSPIRTSGSGSATSRATAAGWRAAASTRSYRRSWPTSTTSWAGRSRSAAGTGSVPTPTTRRWARRSRSARTGRATGARRSTSSASARTATCSSARASGAGRSAPTCSAIYAPSRRRSARRRPERASRSSLARASPTSCAREAAEDDVLLVTAADLFA